MLRHCFSYGSLMCDEIMSAVCGVAPGSLLSQSARLPGYSRHPVRNEHYPGMIPDGTRNVAGIIYLNITSSAWPRLDSFEGEMYERRSVVVTLGNRSVLEADTYVFRTAFASLLEPGDWDYATFLRDGKAHFLDRYLGFGRL